MSIRSIDFQVMIPKAPEVQKIKHTEMQNPHNNSMINMAKQQEQHQQELKRVNEAKKAFEGKVNREKPKKQHSGKDEEEQNSKKKKKQSIDIRI